MRSGSLRASIDALGPVRCLVSPNALHHLFLAEWKYAYPAAPLYASPRLRGKRKDLAFDATLADAPEPEWAADIDQVVLHGSFFLTEVVFSYPGLGLQLNNAVQTLDYPLMQALFLFIALAVLIANFIVDMLYVYIDPRVRDGKAG